jgi:hypothetical protein
LRLRALAKRLGTCGEEKEVVGGANWERKRERKRKREREREKGRERERESEREREKREDGERGVSGHGNAFQRSGAGARDERAQRGKGRAQRRRTARFDSR